MLWAVRVGVRMRGRENEVLVPVRSRSAFDNGKSDGQDQRCGCCPQVDCSSHDMLIRKQTASRGKSFKSHHTRTFDSGIA